MLSTRSSTLRFRSWLSLSVYLCLIFASLAPARAQTAPPVFTPLGDLPGGGFGSVAYDVSADGSVVAGQADATDDSYEGFRWTAQTGMVEIGSGRAHRYVEGISGNGLVLVGQLFEYEGIDQAFRWTSATGTVGLYDSFRSSKAFATSYDGSVVVGWYRPQGPGNTYIPQAFRWTAATGVVGLGFLSSAPGVSSYARAVSADGTVVVGTSYANPGIQAFRWTAATGMVGLSGAYCFDVGVSGNGQVVVGNFEVNFSYTKREGYRWTAATGFVSLNNAMISDTLAGDVKDASYDGSVIVGSCYVPNGDFGAGVWTRGAGMVNLKQYLIAHYSAALPANFAAWKLQIANAVSDDGTVIVGNGVNPDGKPEGWVVRLPVKPGPKWTPIDVAVNRTDSTSRLLWRDENGRYAVWKLSASGAVQIGKYYGPVAGYRCDQIVVAPNGQTTLLWKPSVAGRFALWTLSSDLATIVKATLYNNPAQYTPQNIAADAQNNIRLSLRRTNGQVALWTITPATGAIGGSAAYGPYANLQDGPLAVGADGRIRLLWRNTATKGVTLWTIPSTYGAPVAGYNYNPVAGAMSADIAVGMDNKTRLQWLYPNGKIALWKINTTVGGNGAIEAGKFYGPYYGVSPLGLSVGGDNQTRQLWKYDTGKAALWALNDSLTSVNASYTFGPIP